MNGVDSRLRRVETASDTAQFHTLSSAGRMLLVPPVTALSAVVATNFPVAGRNEVRMSWVEPTDVEVAGYEIWLTLNGATTQIAFVRNSPIVLNVTVSLTADGLLHVITVLRNGSRLDFDLAPTVTGSFAA
jgi:hypothetical protein